MSQRPRAIVFALRHLYDNPTEDALLSSIEKVFDTTYCGPGYLSPSELPSSAEEALERYGPFDAAFFTQYAILAHIYPDDVEELYRSGACFSFDLKPYRRKICTFFSGYEVLPWKTFYIGSRWDTYCLQRPYLDYFARFPGHLFVPLPENRVPVAETPDLPLEGWSHQANDNYLEFCDTYHQKVISLPHIIRESEFYSGTRARPIEVAVPGASYYGRREVLKALEVAGIEAPHEDRLQGRLERYLRRCGIEARDRTWGIRFRRWRFHELLRRSKAVYTDGSRLRVPVRKHFEIPAAGAILLTDMFSNPEALGFVDQDNYIRCDESSIVDVIHELRRRPEWGAAVAGRGYEHIRSRFSSRAYANTLRQIWHHIATDTYRGGQWSAGSFCCSSTVAEGALEAPVLSGSR